MENKIAALKSKNVYFSEEVSTLDAFIEKNNYSKVVVLGDTNTIELCLPYLNLFSTYTANADIIEIDAGEGSKNIDICIGIWNMMLDYEMDRKSLLINLGGGMVSDIGAFAASTYMRGIDFINIPSTLLAMVDASHGGKNGIDVNDFKNIIGCFQPAKAVFIFPSLLNSLNEEEQLFGFAEIIKHGLIADEKHFENTVAYLLAADQSNLAEIIIDSILIKLNIVAIDPLDKKERKILNYGHSIGHAIESYFLSLEKPIHHGLAVLTGIIIENKIAVSQGVLAAETADSIESIIKNNFQLPKFPANAIPTILEFLMHDKKNIEDQIHLSLISKIGEGKIEQVCDIATVNTAIEQYLV